MSTNQHNSVRIIAGGKRGSKIYFDDAPGLRPSGDRIREMLFSWLQTSIVDCRCLDMFAGSGALGFEAASRGAASVLMIEKNRRATKALINNVERLRFDTVKVVAGDALETATYETSCKDELAPFDLVLVDPPFADELHEVVIEFLCDHNLLQDNAFVYVETNKRAAAFTVPDNWDLHREKVAGQVLMRLYRLTP